MAYERSGPCSGPGGNDTGTPEEGTTTTADTPTRDTAAGRRKGELDPTFIRRQMDACERAWHQGSHPWLGIERPTEYIRAGATGR